MAMTSDSSANAIENRRRLIVIPFYSCPGISSGNALRSFATETEISSVISEAVKSVHSECAYGTSYHIFDTRNLRPTGYPCLYHNGNVPPLFPHHGKYELVELVHQKTGAFIGQRLPEELIRIIVDQNARFIGVIYHKKQYNRRYKQWETDHVAAEPTNLRIQYLVAERPGLDPVIESIHLGSRNIVWTGNRGLNPAAPALFNSLKRIGSNSPDMLQERDLINKVYPLVG